MKKFSEKNTGKSPDITHNYSILPIICSNANIVPLLRVAIIELKVARTHEVPRNALRVSLQRL
jgi:hypothetical protein